MRSHWTASIWSRGVILVAAVSIAAVVGAQPTSYPNWNHNTPMQTATSPDGTRIAYVKSGSGPAVVLVNGALADKTATADLAGRLAAHFTVYRYDRRGRGDSGEARPVSHEREIEDIDALVAAAGGTASLVGFSSGAALALEAASSLGSKIVKLALYEPPYDEAEGAAEKWKQYASEQTALLAAGRRSEAVEHHLRFVGLPAPAVSKIKASPEWPKLEHLASTLPYDVAAIGPDRRIPVQRAAKIRANALVMDGGANRETMPFMRASADRIAQAIPGAKRRTLEGEGHNVNAQSIAPVLVEFLSAS